MSWHSLFNFKIVMKPIFIFCFYFSLLGASKMALAQSYAFFNLGIENGLIQSQAQAMVQDSLGQIWIGTLGGLSCYDGEKVKSYTERDGLSNNAINSLALDKENNLWVAGPGGL